MIRLFKLFGLMALFCSAASGGFWAAARLYGRKKELGELCRSLSDLQEYIRLNRGEIEKILTPCFGERLQVLSPGRYRVRFDSLEKEETEHLDAFLADLGMLDAAGECKRIEQYRGLFARRLEQAEQKCRELGRLYGVCGVLGGAFLCIFFL